jgi:DNA-binding transcriptional regulator YdaS (Cro superfamily)
MGQAELARRMTEKLGRSIDRAAVNKMTKGTRDVSAGEMLAIMQITGASLPAEFAAIASLRPNAAPGIPPELVQMALELVLRRLAGMSDSGAQELAALVLEELQAPELLAPGSDVAALRGALDYIVRRSGRKSDA